MILHPLERLTPLSNVSEGLNAIFGIHRLARRDVGSTAPTVLIGIKDLPLEHGSRDIGDSTVVCGRAGKKSPNTLLLLARLSA